MEQAGLSSFEASEKWRTLLFQSLMKTPPAGHRYVTVQQILNADKEMWALSSQQTGGMLKSSPGGDAPVDKPMKELSESPVILCYLTPLMTSRGDDPKRRPKTDPPRNGPKQDPKHDPKPPKGVKRKDETTVKELLKSLPTNCVSKLDNGKFICLHYNKYMQKAEVFVMEHGGSRVLFQSCHALSVATESYQGNLQCNCSQTILWQSWWRFALAAPFCRRRPNEKASRFCHLIILSTDSDRLQQFSS